MKWEKIPIASVCSGIYDGPHATPPESNSGAVFLGISNFVNGRLDLSDIRYISESDLPKWTKRVVPQKHDIVFSYEATLNLYAIIPDDFRGCLGRRMALIRVDESKAHYKYLYYYFYSPAWRAVISEHTVIGATVDRIPLISFPNFPIELPDLPTQHRIASILSAYDDLIENNRRQIKLLEEAAQQLYREWFVELRFPGHENVKIVDGVPEGWSVNKIQDILTVCYGKDHKKVADGDIPVYGSGGYMRACQRPLFTGQSVLIPRKGSLNNIMYVDESFWTVDTMFYTVMKLPHIAHYVFQFMKTLDFYNMNTGAAVPSTTSETLNNLMIMVPKESILKQFDGIVQDLVSMKTCLEKQIRILTDIRDLLLPKLMSGEMEV